MIRCCSSLPWFVATIDAPGMTEPDASRTKPEICPESNCATAIAAEIDNRDTAAKILRNMFSSSQAIDLNQAIEFAKRLLPTSRYRPGESYGHANIFESFSVSHIAPASVA